MDTKALNNFKRLIRRTNMLMKHLDEIDESQLHMNSEGKWSVIQVLNHLLMSEQYSLAYCKKKINAGDNMRDSNFVRALPGIIYCQFLLTRLKFKAPKEISKPSNEESLSKIKVEWSGLRAGLEAFISDYPVEFLDKAIYRHPIGGRLTLCKMVRFLECHMIHHEYQIDRILKNVKD